MSDENHKTEITRLLTTLEHCRQLAHDGEIEPGTVGKEGVQIHVLAAITGLRSGLNAQVDANGRISNELDFLYSFLEKCHKVTMGEAVKDFADVPDFVDQSLIEIATAVIGLSMSEQRKARAIHDLYKQVETLKEDLEFCRCAAKGETSEWREAPPQRSAALDAVIGLREKFEAFNSITFKPAPPGLVPTGPPEKKLSLEEMTRIVSQMPDGLYMWKDGVPTPVPAVLSYHPPIIPPLGPHDKIGSTGNPEAMSGPGKPAKTTGTGDAEEGEGDGK